MKPVKVGIIGCGNISDIYLENSTRTFGILEVVACADLLPEKAKAQAEKYNVPRACSVNELLKDPEIELVLNITIPNAHYDVNIAALEAGKSVYCEKPLSISREQGQRTLETAAKKGLLVGCAPDTFMGGGIQTCRKLIDDGQIGKPIAATAFMMSHGVEAWHPNPEFYYQTGGGPMFDMGPYYLTALISLVGPVKGVNGIARKSFAERTITTKEKHGQKIKVEVPTHIAGTLDFENGAVGTIITSFDIWKHSLPCIEIHGTGGSLSVPDPNTFGGPVRMMRAGESEWSDVLLTHQYAENSRSLGLADMAYALRSGRPHRANGRMAFHVLDVMHAFHNASDAGKFTKLESTCNRPAIMPADLNKGLLDE
jgi:predicted dehydrogenase